MCVCRNLGFVAARKLSLGQGSVFTHVCPRGGGIYPSMHLGEGSVYQHSPGQERVWTGEDMCGQGCGQGVAHPFPI